MMLGVFIKRHQAFGAGLLAFIIYLMTLAPDLTWDHFGGDGGDLITAAATLGVPHPTGYPLYILLGKLVTLLPIGSVAYRLNLLSAMAVAASVGFVSATTSQRLASFRHMPDIPVSRSADTSYLPMIIGLSLAFTSLVWKQAVIAEVYGLNLAFLAALVWALLGRRPSFLSGLLLGLCITSHLSSLIMVPFALSLIPRRQWPRLCLGAAIGLSPLLALPWLGQGDSPVVWGDPSSLGEWWWLVTARLYHDGLFGVTWSGFLNRLGDWGWQLLTQFTIVGGPLLLYSLSKKSSWKSGHPPFQKLTVVYLFGTAGIYLVCAFGYSNDDAIVFTLPALLLFSLLLVPGLKKLGRLGWLLPATSLLVNFNAVNLSSDWRIRPLAEDLLSTAPERAILLTPGDQTIFSLWYYHYVEEQRPDVSLVDANLLAFDWYRRRLSRQNPSLKGLAADDLSAFREMNQETRPFCTAKLQPSQASYLLDCSQ